jgi:hypothetical protein
MRTLLASLLFAAACGGVSPTNPDATASTADAPASTPDATAPTPDAGEEADAEPTPALCANLEYPNVIEMPGTNETGVQDAPAAITPDGDTMLVQRRAVCAGAFRLFVYDGVQSSPEPIELTDHPNLQVMAIGEENRLALTPDARTIVGISTDYTRVYMASRSAPGASDFATPGHGDYAAIAVAAPAQLLGPAVSPDALAFYYTVANHPVPDVNGIYEALRSSTAVAFSAGTRLPDDVQAYSYVTAVSEDNRTLFVQTHSFTMVALSRPSASAAWANPNAPEPPPSVPGFRTRPILGCDRIVATCSGGCINEDTCTYGKN